MVLLHPPHIFERSRRAALGKCTLVTVLVTLTSIRPSKVDDSRPDFLKVM